MVPLVIYSTNTWLASRICARFYGGLHWVCGAAEFDGRAALPLGHRQPPSSSPAEIYQQLFHDADRRDLHSTKINENRAGLLKGAAARRQQGVIDSAAEAEVSAIIHAAQSSDFRPLLYVIPYLLVQGRAKLVPVGQRASIFSEEYIIDDLRTGEFDVIQFP